MQSFESSESSIIPVGFKCTAHKVFLDAESNIKIINSKLSTDKSRVIKNADDIMDIKEEKVSRKRRLDTDILFGDTNLQSKPDSEINNCCFICLDSLSDPVTLIICHHRYCFTCLFSWLKIKDSCPACKSSVKAFIRNKSHSNDIKDGEEIWKRSKNLDFLKDIKLFEDAIDIHRKFS